MPTWGLGALKPARTEVPNVLAAFGRKVRQMAAHAGRTTWTLILLSALAGAALGVWLQAPAAAGAARKEPPLLCGMVNFRIGDNFSTGEVEAQNCMFQAFQSCSSAILVIQINPVGTGGRHTLMTGSSETGCFIVDETQPTVDSAAAGYSGAVVCAALDLDDSMLSESMCSGGPPLAPIPVSQSIDTDFRD